MSDGSEIFGYIGGGAGIVTAVSFVINKLGSRVVQREDEDKASLKADAEKRRENEHSIRESLIEIRGDIRSLKDTFGNVRESLEKMRNDHDREVDAIRKEMKEETEKLEQRLRQDIQRAVSSVRIPRSKPR